ncbi:MAG: hypothetical protein FWD75_01115 [Propionibacteriaceae bacterium]|nr:hypothetical protein [Propionibacteriaceae bacterium]
MVTIVPNRPMSPIVVEFFEDGWFVLTCGAHVVLEGADTDDNSFLIAVIEVISSGRCEEVVLSDDLGVIRVMPSMSSEDDTFGWVPPSGRQILKWALPDWRGEANDPRVTLL